MNFEVFLGQGPEILLDIFPDLFSKSGGRGLFCKTLPTWTCMSDIGGCWVLHGPGGYGAVDGRSSRTVRLRYLIRRYRLPIDDHPHRMELGSIPVMVWFIHSLRF